MVETFTIEGLDEPATFETPEPAKASNCPPERASFVTVYLKAAVPPVMIEITGFVTVTAPSTARCWYSTDVLE